MKQKIIASTLGFGLIASGVLIPWQRVSAVIFISPADSTTLSQANPGVFRGSLFIPASGESALSSGNLLAEASGGSLFTPKDEQPAPKAENGNLGAGASRGGDLFAPKDDQPAPKAENGNLGAGASRGGDLFAPKSSASQPFGENHRTNIEQPKTILALLPQTYFGTTISQRPEILVYLPQSPAREGVFSLKDAQGNTLHKINVPVSGRGGIISIKVPINLEVDKDYQWFLALKIDGELSSRTPYVDGWIKRIEPLEEISTSMEQKDLLKQAKILGENGVWYDCVATLAKLRAIEPNNANLEKEWSELLTSVGLGQIKKAPVMAFNNISN